MAGLNLVGAVEGYYDAKDRKIKRQSAELDLQRKQQLAALGKQLVDEMQNVFSGKVVGNIAGPIDATSDASFAMQNLPTVETGIQNPLAPENPGLQIAGPAGMRQPPQRGGGIPRFADGGAVYESAAAEPGPMAGMQQTATASGMAKPMAEVNAGSGGPPPMAGDMASMPPPPAAGLMAAGDRMAQRQQSMERARPLMADPNQPQLAQLQDAQERMNRQGFGMMVPAQQQGSRVQSGWVTGAAGPTPSMPSMGGPRGRFGGLRFADGGNVGEQIAMVEPSVNAPAQQTNEDRYAQIKELDKRTAPILMKIAALSYQDDPKKIAEMQSWLNSSRRREQMEALQDLTVAMKTNPAGALPAMSRLYGTLPDGRKIDEKNSQFDPQKGIWSLSLVDEKTGKPVGQQKMGAEELVGMIPAFLSPEAQVAMAQQEKQFARQAKLTDAQIRNLDADNGRADIEMGLKYKDRAEQRRISELTALGVIEGRRAQAAEAGLRTRMLTEGRQAEADDRRRASLRAGAMTAFGTNDKAFKDLGPEEQEKVNIGLMLVGELADVTVAGKDGKEVKQNLRGGKDDALSGQRLGAVARAIMEAQQTGDYSKFKLYAPRDGVGGIEWNGQRYVVPADGAAYSIIASQQKNAPKKK